MNPDRKITVGAGMGGLVAVLVWALDAFAGVKMSGEAAVGLSTALVFIVQYIVPNKESSNGQDSGV